MIKIISLLAKHKHRELIDAKRSRPALQIQFELNGSWIDVENPSWREDINYRIKEPDTLRFRRYLDTAGNERLVSIDASTWSDFVMWLGDWQEMKTDRRKG